MELRYNARKESSSFPSVPVETGQLSSDGREHRRGRLLADLPPRIVLLRLDCGLLESGTKDRSVPFAVWERRREEEDSRWSGTW